MRSPRNLLGALASVRDERGLALPTPVVLLSAVAVVLAVIAFVFTGHDKPAERDITPAASKPSSASASPSVEPSKKPKPKPKPVDRGKVKVLVFNNTNIRGLATTVSGRAAELGWKVVGSDNWMGTVPANTVYYPPRLKRAAEQLALDLGIKRTHPAIQGSMVDDGLTIVLTSAL